MIKIQAKKTNELTPYAFNSRTHSQKHIAQIAASIKEFGFTNPVLIDSDGGIVAGHGRVLAAEKMGLTAVPTISLGHLTAQQRKAYVIADNKLALNAGWDEKMLASQLTELSESDFDLSLIGFDESELNGLLGLDLQSGLTDEDDIPEASPKVQDGDVWILGDHRVMCGDSTQGSQVAALFEKVKPHIMVTDPPYGINYDPNWRNEAKRADGTPIRASAVGLVSNDDRCDWSEAWAHFPGDVAYIWHTTTRCHEVADSIIESGFNLRALIVWAKNNFAIGRGDYHQKFEPLWYAVRDKKVGHWVGGRKQTTLWEIDKPIRSETGHSTQKPVECMRRPMQNNSSPGQVVYDPFLGSGTSVIAAETIGRISYGMELNPAYLDITIQRWEDFTGETAKRA